MMYESVLDHNKPAKRREERERCTCGADSADRGQVGFLPFTD